MVQRVQTLLIDDIDDSAAAETVVFGLDGVTYEIDLNSDHADSLRSDLAKWIGHGRKQQSAKKAAPAPTPSRGGAAHRAELAKVREWARANGHDVSERGRIAGSIQEAYARAHS